jgi:hypothetical protein
MVGAPRFRARRTLGAKRIPRETGLLIPSGKSGRFKRSTQHYPIHSFDDASPEEPIYWAVLAQYLARQVPADLTLSQGFGSLFSMQMGFELGVASTH